MKKLPIIAPLALALTAIGLWLQCKEDEEGIPTFPPSGREAYVAAVNPDDPDSDPEPSEQLDKLEGFLDEQAGRTVFLQIELAADEIREDQDDPLQKALDFDDYTAVYLGTTLEEILDQAEAAGEDIERPKTDVCHASSGRPDELVRYGKDRVTVRLDGDCYFGTAIAIRHNGSYETQVFETSNGFRLTGYFRNSGQADHADQLTVTPYLLTPVRVQE